MSLLLRIRVAATCVTMQKVTNFFVIKIKINKEMPKYTSVLISYKYNIISDN